MSIENGSCTILKLQREGERGGEETVGERKKAFSLFFSFFPLKNFYFNASEASKISG